MFLYMSRTIINFVKLDRKIRGNFNLFTKVKFHELEWSSPLKEKHFPACGNHYLWFSFQKKQFFCIEKTYFSTNASFRAVETDFLARTNHFLYIFQRLLPEKAFFLFSGNLSLSESVVPAIGEGFFSLMETVTLLESFFLLAEIVTAMNGNQFLKTELILAGGNWFSG